MQLFKEVRVENSCKLLLIFDPGMSQMFALLVVLLIGTALVSCKYSKYSMSAFTCALKLIDLID